MRSVPSFQKDLSGWYLQNKQDHPWRLDFARTQDPYRVWLSEIMLQQTVIKAVDPVYRRFVIQFPTLADVARADSEEVKLACRGLGYYRRFANFKKAAEVLTASSGSLKDIDWPTTAKGWKDLPGVGEYTAAAVGSIAFGWPMAVLDGNVERVLCRLHAWDVALDERGLKKRLKELADELLDAKNAGNHNQAMMELGQRICTPADPKCHSCPVAKHCAAKKKGIAKSIPRPKQKTPFENVTMKLFIVCDESGRLGLTKRTDDAKFLRATVGLPTAVAKDSQEWAWDSHASCARNKMSKITSQLVGKFRHHITKHKISAEVHLVNADSWPRRSKFEKWCKPSQADREILANLDRKAWLLYKKKFRDGYQSPS